MPVGEDLPNNRLFPSYMAVTPFDPISSRANNNAGRESNRTGPVSRSVTRRGMPDAPDRSGARGLPANANARNTTRQRPHIPATSRRFYGRAFLRSDDSDDGFNEVTYSEYRERANRERQFEFKRCEAIMEQGQNSVYGMEVRYYLEDYAMSREEARMNLIRMPVIKTQSATPINNNFNPRPEDIFYGYREPDYGNEREFVEEARLIETEEVMEH